jgi:chorismate synthase
MSLFYNGLIKIIIFGESHGVEIGGVIEGFPAGVFIDEQFIKAEMKRRAPNGKFFSTNRIEADDFSILSGVYNGKTSGTPIAFSIKNNNIKSSDYDKNTGLLRPSHADYTQTVRYKGCSDLRGGGHLSGRLTAPMVFAGALCKLVHKKYDIKIASHIKKIGNIVDKSFIDYCNEDIFNNLNTNDIPLIDKSKEKDVIENITKIKNDGDSIGAVIECGALNIKTGLGGTMLNSVESRLAGALYSIPGVKGVEFGKGYDFINGLGSTLNDEFILKDGKVMTSSNNNGGILGGITTGMPLIFSVCFKPTPSIFKEQNTVNLNTMKEEKITISGRHDPCIALRAIPVVESVCAITLCDLYLEAFGYYGA